MTSNAPRRLESHIHLILALGLQSCSLSLAMVPRYVRERLRSSDLVAVGLLQRWVVMVRAQTCSWPRFLYVASNECVNSEGLLEEKNNRR